MKKKSIYSLLVYIGSIGLIFLAQWLLTYVFKIEDKDILGRWYVFLETVITFLTLVLVIKINKVALKNQWRDFAQQGIWLKVLPWLLLTYAVNFIASYLSYYIGAGKSANQASAEFLLEMVPSVMILTVVFLGPLLEELIFRYSIFQIFGFHKRTVIISALIFSIPHVLLSLEWLNIIPYFLIGLVFSMAYYRYRNIYLPILIHMSMNGVVTLMLVLFKGS